MYQHQPSPPKSFFPHAKWEYVTPEVAQAWLDASEGQNFRALSEAEAQKYARAMTAGTFRSMNGQTIVFDHDDAVVDGQHRLRGVVISGRPQWFLVVRGVERGDATTIDVGYVRRITQALQAAGVKNFTVAGALAYWSQWYHTGTKPDRRADLSAQLAFVQNTTGVEDACAAGQRVNAVIPGGHGALLHLLAASAGYRDEAEEFLRAVETGIGINSDTDPVYRLRQRMATSGLKGAEKLALIVKAWNFWIAGAKVKALVYRTGGDAAEEFPRFVFPARRNSSAETAETAPNGAKPTTRPVHTNGVA